MIKDIESYRQGIIEGLDIKENYKYKILGYDLNEILDIMEKHMTDKPKHIMTRAEAIELFKEHMPWTGNSAEKVIDFYVVAGMLEIKEEEKLTLPQRVGANLGLDSQTVANVINELIKEGRFIQK